MAGDVVEVWNCVLVFIGLFLWSWLFRATSRYDAASTVRRSLLRYLQQAVSTPMGPAPNGRRRRRPPHGRRTGTTGEWPPATRGSPPALAKAGPGRGPLPRGRVRSR